VKVPYVETGCKVEFHGRTFEAGGAIVTRDRIVAYPSKDGVLCDWHGNPIGRWRILSSWPTPCSFISSTMHSIEAVVDGTVYVGRGAGEGMVFQGKRKALASACKRKLRSLTEGAVRARLAGKIVRALELEADRDEVLWRLGPGHKEDGEAYLTSIETGGAS
jgi:hypothetical protein